MRVEGWQSKFHAYIDKMRNTPFKWGTCDCLIFASDACLITRGIDPMTEGRVTVRGKYETMEEARVLIKKYRKSTPDIMDRHFKRKDVNFATKGDIVYYKRAFGICVGRGLAFFKDTESNFVTVKIADCEKAWDV